MCFRQMWLQPCGNRRIVAVVLLQYSLHRGSTVHDIADDLSFSLPHSTIAPLVVSASKEYLAALRRNGANKELKNFDIMKDDTIIGTARV